MIMGIDESVTSNDTFSPDMYPSIAREDRCSIEVPPRLMGMSTSCATAPLFNSFSAIALDTVLMLDPVSRRARAHTASADGDASISTVFRGRLGLQSIVGSIALTVGRP